MSALGALVTGGTDGIGKGVARALLQAGWQVVIVGRNASRCAATVEDLKREAGSDAVSALVGDLSLMADVTRLAGEFRAHRHSLDLLLLNANSITQTHVLTAEGFEANLAIGYLGRALLTCALGDLLTVTPRSQVLSVVGLNLDRLDLTDPMTAAGFSSMKALGRWQWAAQLFARELTRRTSLTMNAYMPGLVKTKILASEPQPMRFVVQLANLFMGLSVEQAAREVLDVVDQVARTGARDVYFARRKRKGARVLKDLPGDGEALWALTGRLLAPWLSELRTQRGGRLDFF